MPFLPGVGVIGFSCGLVSRTGGAPVTSGTTLCYIVKDNGAQELCTNTAVHKGNGQWTIELTAAEMDATMIGLIFTNPNAVSPVNFTIRTDSGQGDGSCTVTFTVEDAGAVPIDGVQVWITTDVEGNNVVVGPKTTNAFGMVAFLLDPGTYYSWKTKSGYNFTNPETHTFSECPGDFTILGVPITSVALSSPMRREVCVYLYQDAMDHLCDFLGGSALDAEQRVALKAVQNAYTRFANERSWRYLYTVGRINLTAPYSTGTVSYDHTGGTYERQLTFSGALPAAVQTWAKYGRIRINDVVYEIDDYKSSTVVTLTEELNPGEDLTDETFTLYRNQYPLHCDFRKICEPTTENDWFACYIPPEEWLALERRDNASGTPYRFTILQNQDHSGSYTVCVEPYPSAAGTLDFLYQRSPRMIRYSGYEAKSRTGTVTISAGSNVVTGVGTSWTSDMAGSYIRFTDGTTPPDGLGGLNPYLEQAQIKSVTNGTTLILNDTVSYSYAGKPFVISDPVDLPPTFWEAFCRCCEWQLALTGRIKQVEQHAGFYQTALRRCFEMDNVTEIPKRYAGDVQYINRGWDSPLGENIE